MSRSLLRKTRIPWRHLMVFGWLPSSLQVWAYRLLLGYRVGRGVRISFGGVVVGRDVELGDHVEIGLLYRSRASSGAAAMPHSRDAALRSRFDCERRTMLLVR